ncbi:MAG: sulfurtransferase [Pseudomonadales bacterium]|nr:sulfurtransferase [Pseudomonadales bacterium]
MSHLIDAQALKHQLHQDAPLVIIDCRFDLGDPDLGRQQFTEGHIPGAVYADLNQDLSGPVVPGETGRHPLPNPDALCAKFESLGISNSQSVVVYDDAHGAFAARLWWLLRWLGHDRVQVLDGGLTAWLSEGGRLSQSSPDPKTGQFARGDALTRTCPMQEVSAENAHLIDVRSEARFQGIHEPIDPIAGHIPGAINLPFQNNLQDGRFKAPEHLRAEFKAAGIGLEESVICYCGSGVTATHTLLALLEAGFAEPRLYPGSWSEWITDPQNSVARGDHGTE